MTTEPHGPHEPRRPHAELVLVTGSAGAVGRSIMPFLLDAVRVRGFDVAEEAEGAERVDHAEQLAAGFESMRGSILDEAALGAALVGVDAVVHLAGIPSEAPWAELLRVNIDGTQRVLEAARRAGVRRVILASSNHAVGFVRRDEGALPGDLAPRPDTFYGVSKAALEALGHYYRAKHGMDVVSIRIGTADPRPTTRRSLTTWISPRDLAALIVAGLRAPSPVDAVVWGMSANTGSPFLLEGGRALGWEPRDDAADQAHDGLAPESDVDRRYVGGDFTTLPQPD